MFSGEDAATAESIFSKMDEALQDHGVPWKNCVCVGVDNTSVNLGERNLIMTRVVQKHPAVFFHGMFLPYSSQYGFESIREVHTG